jgi:hypothetical protein
MTRLQKILTLVATVLVVLTAFYKFDYCKASKVEFVELKADYNNYQDIQRKRAIEQRIWDIQRQKPSTWQNDPEYRRLKQELDLLIMKINAYYNRGKG